MAGIGGEGSYRKERKKRMQPINPYFDLPLRTHNSCGHHFLAATRPTGGLFLCYEFGQNEKNP